MALALLAISIPAFARSAEIIIENASDEPMRLYVDDGHNYEFEGVIRARSRPTAYPTEPGETWAFGEVHRGELEVLKETTVKVWGRNELVLTNRDLQDDGHDHDHDRDDDRGGGGILRDEITVFNRSSIEVDVYADHGTGWHKEGTLRPGTRQAFPCSKGDDWGVDDPSDRRLDLVGVTTIRNFDVLPSLTVVDRDFGIAPPPLIEAKFITIVNRTSHDFDVYANHGDGWHREGVVAADSTRKFETAAGDRWAVDDPRIRGLNPMLETEVRNFGINTVTITEALVHGPGGGPPPPPINPPGGPAGGVTITIKNLASLQATVYRKTGLFNKSYVGVIGRYDSESFRFRPGDWIVIERDDLDDKVKYEVGGRSAVIEIPR